MHADPCTADHARVALCGNISPYDSAEPYGLKGLRYVLMHRITVHGFVIAEHRDYWPTAVADNARWVREGRITYREDVDKGLENAPAAFIRMLTGAKFGKALVDVGAS